MTNMTMTVHVGKINESFEVVIHKSSIDYLLQYGLNQSVNDAHSTVEKGSEDFAKKVRAKVEARIKQIVEGTVPTLRGPAPITDEAIAKSLGVTVEVVRAMREQAAKAVEATPPKAPETTLIKKSQKAA